MAWPSSATKTPTKIGIAELFVGSQPDAKLQELRFYPETKGSDWWQLMHSNVQAVRDLVAEGVTDTAEIIAEAKKRWKMGVSKPTVYQTKAAAKAKGKKAKPKAKAKAAAKGGSTQDAVKALKGVVDQQGIEKTRELLDIMEALKD